MLKNVTAKISGRYQKFMATKGAAMPIVASLKPTAKSFVTKAGNMFTNRVIMRMIDKKTIKI